MKFKEYKPAKLRGIVELIWEHEIPAKGGYLVLPSGKVELLFPIYPDVGVSGKKILEHDNPVKSYSFFLSGLHTKPLKMTFDRFHVFGIQMRPVAVKAIFGIPLCKIRDYYIEGTEVFDTINIIEDHIYSKSTFLERAHWFENFLIQQIRETAELHTAIKLDKVVKEFLAQPKHGSLKSIEQLMGYSRTQTYRLFNDWFGISAHAYQKLSQFTRTVETLHDRNVKLTDIGFANGYYDQSHFIRRFQEFADMTPGEYRKHMTRNPGQIIM